MPQQFEQYPPPSIATGITAVEITCNDVDGNPDNVEVTARAYVTCDEGKILDPVQQVSDATQYLTEGQKIQMQNIIDTIRTAAEDAILPA